MTGRAPAGDGTPGAALLSGRAPSYNGNDEKGPFLRVGGRGEEEDA